MLANSVVTATIPCIDLERARQFYEGRLGLAPSQEALDGVSYSCKDGTRFLLYPSSFAGTAQSTAMTWVVDDLVAEMSELRARGVVFEEYDLPELKTVNGVVEFPGGRVAWFKDTEGNTLGLTQMG